MDNSLACSCGARVLGLQRRSGCACCAHRNSAVSTTPHRPAPPRAGSGPGIGAYPVSSHYGNGGADGAHPQKQPMPRKEPGDRIPGGRLGTATSSGIGMAEGTPRAVPSGP